MDLRARIDTSPMRPYQWLIVALCVVLNILDGYDVMALAFTAKSIGADFALGGSAIGVLLSAGLIGMAVGAITLAPVADRVGRRPLILLSVALATAGMALSATAGSAWQLGTWRVLTGLGIGGVLACTTVIASEYSSARWRGLAISIYTAGYGVGATLGGLAAVGLQTEYGWRAVFVVGAVLTGTVLVLLAALLPESIEFLGARGRDGDLASINRIARRIGQDPIDSLDGSTRGAGAGAGRIADLFTGSRARPTLLLWAAFFTTMFGFYFVNSWTPSLLETAGLTKDQSATAGMMLTLGGTVGSVLFGVLASRWSTRSVLITFTGLSAAAMAVFIASISVLAVAFALGIVIGGLINGCIAGLYTLAPSLYGPRVRSTGVGWAIGVGRAGAILAPTAAGMLLDAGWSPAQLYFAVAGVVVLAAVALLLLRPARTPAATPDATTPDATTPDTGAPATV
ncbi:MFS transporter [Rhodococcus sp. GXMU-t2271]|uniref:MFS transporter n=1 Tax=Rhodococcus indonesiensis TaxID=3055869 RepID=A0ABT7RPN5_9NOCA|nr:MFS transporter [Rhodococcus indonesiensis]MDM7489607.1 MFS transporter [Rhodococcus indonesiensis]